MRFPSVQDLPSMEELAKMARRVVEQAPKALRTVKSAAEDIAAGAAMLEQAVERIFDKEKQREDRGEIEVRDERDGRKV